MDKSKTVTTILTWLGIVLGAAGSVVAGIASRKSMNETIKEEVQKAMVK